MRRFLSSTFLFLCTVVALADVSDIDNVIYLSPSTAKPNSEATLSIKMKNTAAVRGFQFDMYLPEGVTVAKTSGGKLKASLSSGRRPVGDQHTLTLSERTDGAIRFLCGSLDDETFTGNDGEVATVTIVVGDVAEGDKAITLRNIKLTETDISKSYTTDELISTLTISSQEHADVNDIDNVIYLEPFAVEPGGEVQLKLKMKNTAAIRGFQFDLYLPEGMTAKKYANGRIVSSLNDARRPDGDEHTLTLSERPDGAIRFLCGSQYDETFTGSDGEIATLTINVSADMEEDDYPVYLRHVKLTETDISKYYLTDEIETTAMVTRSPWLPGDATEDGDVNVTDIMAVANWILKIKMDKFNLLAADVNGDGDINVTDIMGIANIILKVTPSSNSRAASVADAVEPQ